MKPRLVTTRSIVDFHEAGHAVIGTLYGRGIESLTNVANAAQNAEGMCLFRDDAIAMEQLGGGASYQGPLVSQDDFAALAAFEQEQEHRHAYTRRWVAEAVIITFAGPLAVTVHAPSYLRGKLWEDGANAADRAAAVDALQWLDRGPDLARVVAQAEAFTLALMKNRRVWRAIESVVDALAAAGTLDGETVKSLVLRAVDPAKLNILAPTFLI